LHYLGDSETEAEIVSLKQTIESNSVKVVTVPGDIANPETSTKVRSSSCVLADKLRKYRALDCRNCRIGLWTNRCPRFQCRNLSLCRISHYAPRNLGKDQTGQPGRNILRYSRYATCLSDVPYSHLFLAVANQMKSQTPQGGSIIGISSISALVGGELQW
jgi:L-rhamnose 1-dehydrogenase